MPVIVDVSLKQGDGLEVVKDARATIRRYRC